MISTTGDKTYDLAIVGGGVLGTTLAYWLSLLYEGEGIVVLEKEKEVALHASRRNTGVVHRPFYLDPEKKKIFARAALLSFPLWEKYALVKKLPWANVGTLEVALNKADLLILERYRNWALENGMAPEEIELLDRAGVKRLEKNVECYGALFCKTDTATDFHLLAQSLKEDAHKNGVEFLLNSRVEKIKNDSQGLEIILDDSQSIFTRYLINCAGDNSVQIAHLLGVALELTDLNFRGEYWVVKPALANLATHNIYSVPHFGDFPFLDPHWIKRWDGRAEIGPTAVPVFSAYAYDGLAENMGVGLRKIFEKPWVNKLKLFFNSEFLRLALKEWQSSFSNRVMVERVKKFLPEFGIDYLEEKGLAGIRSQVINERGRFVKEALEFFGPFSFHVLNFNSPGATGAPAYTAYLLKKLRENHCLDHLRERLGVAGSGWNYHAVSRRFEESME